MEYCLCLYYDDVYKIYPDKHEKKKLKINKIKIGTHQSYCIVLELIRGK